MDSVSMDKTFVLDEIKRITAGNGGKPPGAQRFRNETGIKEHEWGKLWRNWGDALTEAGFAPNPFGTAYDKSELLRLYADLARSLGRLPVKGDLRVARHADPNSPSDRRLAERFGGKTEMVKELADFCRTNGDYADVLALCEAYSPPKQAEVKHQDNGETDFGYVYLMKSGRHFKIGKTNAADRRHRELAIQLPEKAKTVHVISTDDPTGIEAYWHNRFKEKRLNGEWFDLSASDVTAFKRRKFM